ncbi:hypothetical protein BJ322DRAFT_1009432 [Thelephora terrestris]|uniref:Uncharacterized protein n=1 Tax=Thelephora terrestris TaxID=56493 RepID=A0A9P6HBC7_9AGAM|nr:hypothetical protein BJ322DRAFT_1009432 [Thelephora terrestris]
MELPSWGSILAAANEAVKSAGDGLSTIASEFDVNEVVKAAGESFSTVSSEFDVNKVFKTAGESFTTITSAFDVKRRVEELESTIQDIVAASSEIRGHMAELTQKGLTLDNISDELEGIFNEILVYLEETFPPPDQAPSHKERLKMTATILDKVEQAILDFGRKHGMSEDRLERVRKTFSSSKPHIEKLVVLTGDLAEQHPVLSKVLISAAVAMLLSKLDIPRRILGLIGFGPRGPIKGMQLRSFAAWAQRRFWGATVEKDSWFSILQKAGMKENLWPQVS